MSVNYVDNSIDETPRVSQLVWIKDLTLDNPNGEASLVERCERITQYDEYGISTIMLHAVVGESKKIPSYTNNLGVTYKSGDMGTYPLDRLKRYVSGNGHVYWKLKDKKPDVKEIKNKMA